MHLIDVLLLIRLLELWIFGNTSECTTISVIIPFYDSVYASRRESMANVWVRASKSRQHSLYTYLCTSI